jgi:hypothetical protein
MSESPPNAWIHVPSEELQSFAAPLFVAAGLDVYRYHASFFWAAVRGERSEGHPNYRAPLPGA